MDFSAFDTKKTDEYATLAKATWGKTPEYCEFEQKSKNRTKAEEKELNEQMMHLFTEFGAITNEDPASEKAQMLVQKLQEFITRHFYVCSQKALSELGTMYSGGGEMTQNIDKYGGEGTAKFANESIKIFCDKK